MATAHPWWSCTEPELERPSCALVLLAPPQLPGTRCPPPYRVMGTPGLFGLVQRIAPPSFASSQRFAKLMGEGDTITGHPDLLDLMVAAANNQATARTNVNEVRGRQPDLTAELVNRFVHDDATSAMGDSTQWRADIQMGIAPDAVRTASAVPSTSNRTRGDVS